MMRMRTVEIDFDVHRAIETARRSFDDSPNAALRRLLGLPENKEAPSHKAAEMSARAWHGDGVILPDGTKLRFEYGKVVYEGEIKDGFWLVGEHRESSPSGAASAVARTKANGKVQLDGWKYWRVKRPDDERWTELSDLRPSRSSHFTAEQLGL